MTNLRMDSVSGEVRHARYVLGGIAFLLAGYGAVRAEGLAELVAYMLVVAGALLPAVVWLGTESRGMPVLPVGAAPYIIYFAFPLLSSQGAMGHYTPLEAMRAGATVCLFLVAATGAAWLCTRLRHVPASHTLERFTPPKLVGIVLVGMATGIVFFVTLMSGLLPDLGPYFGLVRSVVYMLTYVACFLMGLARARGLLVGTAWRLALAGIAVEVILQWSTLFLIAGLLYGLAALAGYVIESKRIPWLPLALAAILVSVLHAGKAEMRTLYWDDSNNFVDEYSVFDVPSRMTEWVTAGMAAIASDSPSPEALSRASLVQMLLRAQRLSPESVEFLDGATYALIPQMLVPRFLNPDKITSQAGMNLLNVHYGLQSERATETTAIGWGLVAEAYANYAYMGVAVIGVLIGLFAGAMTRWSHGAGTISLPMFMAIAAIVNLINMEADLASLATNIWQSGIAVVFIVGVFRAFAKRESARRRPVDSREEHPGNAIRARDGIPR